MRSSASGEIEQAYAWGWASHVMADAAMHPLINQGVGLWLQQDREQQVTYAEHPAAHVRMELGLDASIGLRSVDELPFSLQPVFVNGAAWLAQAFQDIYGVDLSRELIASHRAVCRWIDVWQALECVAARQLCRSQAWRAESWARAVHGAGWLATTCLPQRNPARGLFRPLPPPEWLVSEFDRLTRVVIEQLVEFASGDLQLANLNLDTGGPESAPYEPTTATEAKLAELRKREAG